MIYFKVKHQQMLMSFFYKKFIKICIFFYHLDKLQKGGVDMDKNFIKKPIDFVKKEGFYIVLFICLCVVATAAILTFRSDENQKVNQNKTTISQQKKNSETAITEDKHDNALQVKQNSSKENSKENTNVQKQEASKSVSSSTSMDFQKPVEGNIARGYSQDPVYWDSTESYRPNLGYEIQAKIGTPVFAAMSGKVEKIDKNTQDGVEVIINHQNGLKTIYSNLNSNLKVSEGQDISKGQVIGVVGNTTLRSAYEKYGDHLHFAVLKGDEFVDPARYIKY
jgi:murein DD-endopeptidase MepM/ murein hydrolase activator NlpD